MSHFYVFSFTTKHDRIVYILCLHLQSSFRLCRSLKPCLSVSDHSDFHAVKSHGRFSVRITLSPSSISDILGHCLPCKFSFLSASVRPYSPVLHHRLRLSSFPWWLSSSSACWNAVSQLSARAGDFPPSCGLNAIIFYAIDFQNPPRPLESQRGLTNLTWPRQNSWFSPCVFLTLVNDGTNHRVVQKNMFFFQTGRYLTFVVGAIT